MLLLQTIIHLYPACLPPSSLTLHSSLILPTSLTPPAQVLLPVPSLLPIPSPHPPLTCLPFPYPPPHPYPFSPYPLPLFLPFPHLYLSLPLPLLPSLYLPPHPYSLFLTLPPTLLPLHSLPHPTRRVDALIRLDSSWVGGVELIGSLPTGSECLRQQQTLSFLSHFQKGGCPTFHKDFLIKYAI